MRESFEKAVRHIARFGDTDIFPYPFERHVFHDKEAAVVELLLRVHKEFFDEKGPSGEDVRSESYLGRYPPENHSSLVQAGPAGFRWATELDPLWDAYLLGLVLHISEEIEAARIPLHERSVFSYRLAYDPESHSLFRPDHNWRTFMEASIARAEESAFVVSCDIGDFYPRVYHHRIQNALLQVAGRSDIPKRIDKLLSSFSPGSVSFGLPVGGNAARILAELALNAVDRLLKMRGIRFCRYVDDYHLFASSKEQAFKALLAIAEILQINEGMSLQKSKTRIMSTAEFASGARLMLGIQREGEFEPPAGEHDLQASRFMRLHIRFDPYSANPEEEYEATKEAVAKFDVLGLLSAEIGKSRIHAPLVRQLVRAARALPDDILAEVADVLADNMGVLAPVFPHLALLFRDIGPRLPPSMCEKVVSAVLALIRDDAPVMQVDLHKSYALRIIQAQWNGETEAAAAQLYDTCTTPLIRKDVILLMAYWGNFYWVSELAKRFNTLSSWERRACIVASYCLRDEGKHWRKNKQTSFSPIERIVKDWAALKTQDEEWKITP